MVSPRWKNPNGEGLLRPGIAASDRCNVVTGSDPGSWQKEALRSIQVRNTQDSSIRQFHFGQRGYFHLTSSGRAYSLETDKGCATYKWSLSRPAFLPVIFKL